ncbi:MAG: aminotransferase class I/II-fold pyridoxal phosphate-dependent enzyme [Dehalococcoidales bacterium]|nr:aminotransferase class I/II-fold pyridoxal phosphate-dependent enzyme [Dehalococcoidales bacterium]
MKDFSADRTHSFTESVIREMTRLCYLYQGSEALNLAQGFPDFPSPPEIKEAACRAIRDDLNQYSITWGSHELREAIARKVARFRDIEADPETMITITCGATEAMIASLLAVVNPGEEVVVFAPFYENYGPDTVLSGARPRFVTLHEPDWHFDPAELAAAFSKRTKAIVINTPNNPTGKVFSRRELQHIADQCRKWDCLAITDEIYEHLVYNGEHVSLATLPGMAERTITISGFSKTYSVTGWRVGYVIASPELSNAIRKVHDFLTVAAPHPLQAAAVTALGLPDQYYADLLAAYRLRRDYMLEMLTKAGFRCFAPDGAYYVMADISAFGYENDVAFAHHLVRDVGFAVVPGSSFYHDPALGSQRVRFCFAKKMETLRQVEALLAKI